MKRSKAGSGNFKYQLDMFCGRQSFILRTNSLSEVLAFSGIKKLNAKEVTLLLQNLHLSMGQYDIPLAPPDRKEKKTALESISYKEQLITKIMGKSKAIKMKDAARVRRMSEKEAQEELFKLLRGKQ